MDWIEAPRATPLNELHQTELVLPRQANHYGTLFAPEAMALLGKTAFLTATAFTRQSMVMAAARSIDFLAPAPVGSLLHLHSRVVRLGRTSLTVEVRARLDAAAGTQGVEVLRGSFELVAVDDRGRPCPLRLPDNHTLAPVPPNPTPTPTPRTDASKEISR